MGSSRSAVPKTLTFAMMRRRLKSQIQAMSATDLDAAIAEGEKASEEAEETFKTEVNKLQEKYQALSAEKDATVEAVKNSGLGLMKAIKAAGPAVGSDEL